MIWPAHDVMFGLLALHTAGENGDPLHIDTTGDRAVIQVPVRVDRSIAGLPASYYQLHYEPFEDEWLDALESRGWVRLRENEGLEITDQGEYAIKRWCRDIQRQRR